jgi:hypothetical protein
MIAVWDGFVATRDLCRTGGKEVCSVVENFNDGKMHEFLPKTKKQYRIKFLKHYLMLLCSSSWMSVQSSVMFLISRSLEGRPFFSRGSSFVYNCLVFELVIRFSALHLEDHITQTE